MFESYGTGRVLGNRQTLPVLAWRLDNRRILHDNEMLIRVTRLRVEGSSFSQICTAAQNDPERIKDSILKIVEQRGKLHNPFTNTGGLIAGVVEKIGKDYVKNGDVNVGDEVIVMISTSMIPLSVERILSVDCALGHLQVEGHAVLFDNCAVCPLPRQLSPDLLLSAFEEAASLFHVNQLAESKKDFLVVGSNFLTTLLYGYSIRKAVGSGGRVVALLHREAVERSFGAEREIAVQSLDKVFDRSYFMNLSNVLECAQTVIRETPGLFDLSVNCAEAVEAESINVLATKGKGSIYLSNLINNYNVALFLTEAIGRELNIFCADSYSRGCDTFMLGLLTELTAMAGKGIQAFWESGRTTGTAGASGSAPASRDAWAQEAERIIGNAIVYESPAMRQLVRDLFKAAKYDSPVLIQGETGVGKELFANLIHKLSGRKMYPCIKVNCAAIAAPLMESEFFGYEKGAFTGAREQGKKGFFDLAEHGTLLLDEISEIPLELQAKLLRVLQENEFYRVGGQKAVHTDVRVVAVCNKNLKEQVEKQQFREDLYYRLAVLPLYIPPLRQRQSDLLPLTEHFLASYNRRFGINKKISDEGLQYMMEYSWPGNIRELENMVQRLLINSEDSVISGATVLNEMNRGELALAEAAEISAREGVSYSRFMAEQERAFLAYYLKKYGSTRKASEALNMTQAQFMRRKKKYDL